MKLSARATETLKLAPGERDRIVFDEVIPGWGLRLRESGKAYWVFQYAVPTLSERRYCAVRVGTALRAFAHPSSMSDLADHMTHRVGWRS